VGVWEQSTREGVEKRERERERGNGGVRNCFGGGGGGGGIRGEVGKIYGYTA